MYMTKQMLSIHHYQIHTLVAKHLKIDNPDWKSIKELNDNIKNESIETHKLLEEYVNASIEWLNTHIEIKKVGKTDQLIEKLHSAITKRDSTRKNLVNSVNK